MSKTVQLPAGTIKRRPSAASLVGVPAHLKALVPSHGKSPWNPSEKAEKRVYYPLVPPTVHHECGGGAVQIAHHTDTMVYGRAHGDWPWVYLCLNCGARVGMHPFTNIPLGTLADKALRDLRRRAKTPFELLWQPGPQQKFSRPRAYALLAAHLGVEVGKCHFGWFDSESCLRAEAWAWAQLRGGVA